MTTTAAAETDPVSANEHFRTLLGDKRDRVLQEIKRNIDWSKIPEQKQHSLNSGVEQVVREIIREVAKVTAARNYPAIPVTVGNLTHKAKDGIIEVKMTAPGTEENWMNFYAAGRMTAVKIDYEDYMGERAPATVMKDQPDLMDAAAIGAAQVAENTARLEAGIRPLEADGASGDRGESADTLAADQQAQALADATDDERTTVETASGRQVEVLNPEVQDSSNLLPGIQPLDASMVDPIEDTPAKPKRRGRRSVEERQQAQDAALGATEQRAQ